MGEFILLIIIFTVINSFVLYAIIRNAINNSTTLQQIEAKVEVLTKQLNNE